MPVKEHIDDMRENVLPLKSTAAASLRLPSAIPRTNDCDLHMTEWPMLHTILTHSIEPL